MAAVLASIFPQSWHSADSRAQREVRDAESKMPAKHQVVVPAHDEMEVEESTVNPSEDEHKSEQEQSEAEQEIPEVEQDGEWHESPQGDQSASLRRTSKRKRTNQQEFKKNARLKSSASETEVSAESNGSSEGDEDGEAPWEAEGDSASDNDQAIVDGGNCLFCGQDENDDPGEEFEEPFSCGVCGERAHRQCAREANSPPSEEDSDSDLWRCPSCVQNGFEIGNDSPNTQLRRSSAPKLARDLLPAERDDPMDGSRSLRKRKASSESQEKPYDEIRKRSRRTTSESEKTKPVPPIGLDGQQDEELPTTPATVEVPTPRTRGSRRAAERTEKQLVSIAENRKGDVLTVTIRLPPSKLGSLENERRKKRKREYERARRERLQKSSAPEPEVNHFPGLPPQTLREQYLVQDATDEKSKSKPYGGILNDTEADTSKTFPQPSDMRKFEDARQKAEEEWKKKVRAAAAADSSRSTTKMNNSASKIKCINFSGYEIDTWHAAPYPEEYTRNRVLYICEFCLKYMNSDFVAWRHKLKCPAKHPPGDEIYRDGSFSFFEVDGRKNPVYCQNLCLLAKLFLGSKTLYYDVEPFLFYIMTENDDYGCHFVGYFSKEKRPSSLNNVSCILVLPIHQRRGFGNLLIDFSYLLTRTEGKTGSPEKPLSDMGLVTYRSYWRLIMCYELVNQRGSLSINDLSERTGMTADDVVCALEGLRALVRDPVTRTYALRLDFAFMREYIARYEAKGYAKINETALLWVPYVMGRDNQHYETAAPLHTVAQRDDGDDAEPEEGVQQTAAKTLAEATSDSAEKEASTPEEQDPSVAAFPTLRAQDSTTSNSPPTVTPTTPFLQVDGADGEDHAIPATRFEIFPPVPGTSTKKKGRPPKRPSALRNSSTRGGLSFEDAPNPLTSGRSTMLRRGRSKLGEVINGEDLQEPDDDNVDTTNDEQPSPSHGRGGAGLVNKLDTHPNDGQTDGTSTFEHDQDELMEAG